METLNDIPLFTFKNSSEWESWLDNNYTLNTGVWIKLAKKDSGIESITQPEALDVALCYGWIDGQRRGLDNLYYLQKYTPRRSRSLWSKVNIAKVEVLMADGRMQAPGLKEIETAKSDGRWDAAYESQKNATIPPDLEVIFKQNKQAKEFYDSLNKTNQYSVLWQLMTAKTPTVRATRLRKILEMLETGEKLH